MGFSTHRAHSETLPGFFLSKPTPPCFLWALLSHLVVWRFFTATCFYSAWTRSSVRASPPGPFSSLFNMGAPMASPDSTRPLSPQDLFPCIVQPLKVLSNLPPTTPRFSLFHLLLSLNSTSVLKPLLPRSPGLFLKSHPKIMQSFPAWLPGW